MDHAIRLGRSAAQAFEIFKVASLHLGAGGGERLGARVRAGEADHLMSRTDQVLDDRRAYPSGRPSDEHSHRNLLGFGPRPWPRFVGSI